ncbi:hypothetical protein BASA81_009105 [Batrachochytrium salamandrivorans]|nr:hypothetical protein BASA81_009105 [Batrachochytrium salamandrivorans]
MFASTRDYHDARRAWVSTLPKPAYPESELVPDAQCVFLGDLDVSFMGKQGVFFSVGNCYYAHRRVAKSDMLVGFAKFLTPHVGSVVIVVDDLQAITCGPGSVTKTLQMEILPGFEFAGQNFSFVCQTARKPVKGGEEIATQIDLVDCRTGKIAVKSSAVFVRLESMLKMMDKQTGQDVNAVWNKAANMRLAGEHPLDLKMSFRMTLPRLEELEDELPKWWDASIPRTKPRASQFEGRFDLYNVEKTGEGVRAVVYPQITAEGPPTLFHGGGGASCALEVLLNLLPDLQVDTYQIRFRRPVHVTNKIAVEWTRDKDVERQWKGQVFDWNQGLAQELVLTEKRLPKI